MAGATAQISIYPLEVIKTRIAVAAEGTYRGLMDCFKKTVAAEGIKGLYTGIRPALLGIVPYAGTDLALYNTFKARYQTAFPDQVSSKFTLLGFGATSSIAGQLVSYPLALIRTRLQAQGTGGRPVLYNGTLDCARAIYAGHGMRGLYAGLGPNMLKAVPAISIGYVVYETAREELS